MATPEIPRKDNEREVVIRRVAPRIGALAVRQCAVTEEAGPTDVQAQ